MPRGIDTSQDASRRINRELFMLSGGAHLGKIGKKPKYAVGAAPPNDPNDSNKNTPLRKDFVEHKKDLSKGGY